MLITRPALPSPAPVFVQEAEPLECVARARARWIKRVCEELNALAAEQQLPLVKSVWKQVLYCRAELALEKRSESSQT